MYGGTNSAQKTPSVTLSASMHSKRAGTSPQLTFDRLPVVALPSDVKGVINLLNGTESHTASPSPVAVASDGRTVDGRHIPAASPAQVSGLVSGLLFAWMSLLPTLFIAPKLLKFLWLFRLVP